MVATQSNPVIAGSSSALSCGGGPSMVESRPESANTANTDCEHTELGKCKHDKRLLAPVQDPKLSRIRAGLDSH